jgi:aspartate racemase
MANLLENTVSNPEVANAELVQAHYRFQHGIFITEMEEQGESISIHSKLSPSPMWNHTAILDENPEALEQTVEAARSWHWERNRKPIIYLNHSSSEGLHLAQIGLERFDQEAWMIFRGELSDAPRTAEVAKSSQELNEFVEVFNRSFSVQGNTYDSALLEQGAPYSQEHFVLRVGGRVVSVATLIRDDQFACIYNVGTPPQERKHGYAERLMRDVIAHAQRFGSGTIFLQVEHCSPAERLYTKLGFQTLFKRLGYRLSEAAPRQVKRTRLSNVFGYRTEGQKPGVGLERRPFELSTIKKLNSLADRKQIEPRWFYFGTWTYLLSRYLGEESVSTSVQWDQKQEASVLRVDIDRSKPVLEWVRELHSGVITANNDVEETSIITVDKPSLKTLSPIQLNIVSEPLPSLEISYRTDFFSKDLARRMAGHFATALESMVDGAQTLGDIEILSAREKNQLLVEWNQNSAVTSTLLVPELFEKQVERTPDATALMLAEARNSTAKAQLTYRQLNRRANKLAHHLIRLGAGREKAVGVLLDRSLEMIVSLLAIFKAGAVCVPLDPAYPAERLQFILEDTGAPLLISTSSSIGQLATATQLILLDDERERLSKENDKNPGAKINPEDAAYIIYTSGSTGQPKGVVIPHHAIAGHSIDCQKTYGLSSKDKVLQFSSFHFDAAFEQIIPALISGATLVIRDAEIWNTREFAAKLQEFELTVTDIPTAYWHELCDQWSAEPGAIPPNSVRMMIVGGEALSPEKLKLWHQTPLNRVRLINAYGPTETTITAASFEITESFSRETHYHIFPIGRPRGDRSAYVLDKNGNPVPVGVPGELHIGGTMLARGYHNRPDLTAAKFIPNPFNDDPNARIYKTGDLVRFLEDGNLEFLGRIDDQVKIRGYRIELGEIEAVLLKHPCVREALVIAGDDKSGNKRLKAYFTHQKPCTIESVRHHLKAHLPDYMVPSYIIGLEKWPLFPNGKINRQALPEPEEAQGKPAEIMGPRDSLELQLQLIFERVLKKVPVGVDISFFELGGDSLQALELLVEIERATGKNLPLGTLYQSSTVEAIAREIRERAGTEQWSCLVPLQRRGKRAPLYFLHTTPGDILGYGNLVFHLPQDQPCHGFQALGLKDSSLSHQSIDEMARYYVTLLKEFQPKGPYFLGGWCYGGILALEMARLLKADGEEIGLLALLETPAMPPALSNWRYYAHRLNCFLKMGPANWVSYSREKARYARESKMANRMRFRQSESLVDADLTVVAPHLARLEHLYNTNLKALDQYRSTYYDGKITLFNASEKDPAVIPDPYYGWIGLAREIEIYEVDGNHDTMLTEPNVRSLAEKLDQCLLAAQESKPK